MKNQTFVEKISTPGFALLLTTHVTIKPREFPKSGFQISYVAVSFVTFITRTVTRSFDTLVYTSQANRMHVARVIGYNS